MNAKGFVTAQELEVRYGELVPLAELVTYLHTSLRALRPLLRERGIQPIAVGNHELVPLPLVEAALGLHDVRSSTTHAEAQADRDRFTRHPGGQRKTIDELGAEVRAGAAARRAVVEDLA